MTGATGVVGSCIVEALVDAGLTVVAIGRDTKALGSLRAKLGPQVVAMPCDLTAKDSLNALTRELMASLSTHSVLVNSAGTYGRIGPVSELSLEDWTEAFEINVFAAAVLASALLPGMERQRWGRIINVSSAASLAVPIPFNGLYGASKAALDRLTAQIATEAAPGVTCHALHPGEFRSALTADIAKQSREDKRFSSFHSWTQGLPESTEGAVPLVRRIIELLDDDQAAKFNGYFLWPSDESNPPVDLRRHRA